MTSRHRYFTTKAYRQQVNQCIDRAVRMRQSGRSHRDHRQELNIMNADILRERIDTMTDESARARALRTIAQLEGQS